MQAEHYYIGEPVEDIKTTSGCDSDVGSDHGVLSVGNSGDYDQSSTLPDKGDNVKWRRLARRAGALTVARAEIIGQRLVARGEQLREEGEPNWQLLVDESNTFYEWLEHCQTTECAFGEYQGWRPPLRPRRRRKQ